MYNQFCERRRAHRTWLAKAPFRKSVDCLQTNGVVTTKIQLRLDRRSTRVRLQFDCATITRPHTL